MNQNILTSKFLHSALWYNYATWTNEIHTSQINTVIQFSIFDVFHISNCPENEPMSFETSRCQKLKN